jgi:hypothetical protein
MNLVTCRDNKAVPVHRTPKKSRHLRAIVSFERYEEKLVWRKPNNTH